MNNYIIKGAGTIDEICTALKTMQAVFGNDAKLSDVAFLTRYAQIKNTIRKQFDEGESGK